MNRGNTFPSRRFDGPYDLTYIRYKHHPGVCNDFLQHLETTVQLWYFFFSHNWSDGLEELS